ncbi:hypothetical protein ABIC63_002180 [Pseudacidovorax sp. 1753]|uniref:hypothetical protein n=1 Tax=Pseudacidovorax sp. 1753 TaxID=3156419 RepID=UPI0033984B91
MAQFGCDGDAERGGDAGWTGQGAVVVPITGLVRMRVRVGTVMVMGVTIAVTVVGLAVRRGCGGDRRRGGAASAAGTATRGNAQRARR